MHARSWLVYLVWKMQITVMLRTMMPTLLVPDIYLILARLLNV
jgi:hypothetical protein